MAKPQAKTKTFIVEGKKCIVAQPDFKQLTFGLEAFGGAGKINLVGGGKAIFDVCVVECDKEIKEDGKMLMSLCLRIAEEFLLPYEVEVKKN